MITLLTLLSFHVSAVAPTELSFTYPESIKTLLPNKHALVNLRAWNHIEAAHNAYQQNNTSQALEHTHALFERYQNNPVIISHGLKLMLQLSLTYGSSDEQLELAKEILRLNSINADDIQQTRYILAQLYIEAQNYDEAIQHLVTWFDLANKAQISHQNYYLLAYAYFHNKNYSAAVSSSNEALRKLAQDDEQLLAIKMNAALAMDNLDLAIETQTQLIRVNPSKKTYWNNWINLLRRQNKNAEALNAMELMRQVHKLNANETRIYCQLLLDQQFPERAATHLDVALKAKKLTYTNQNLALLAQAWELAGHLDNAIKALASSPEPLSLDSLKRLVHYYATKELWSALVILSDQYKKNFATDSWMQLQAARALYETGQNLKAVALLEKVVSSKSIGVEIKQTAQSWLAYISQP